MKTSKVDDVSARSEAFGLILAWASSVEAHIGTEVDAQECRERDPTKRMDMLLRRNADQSEVVAIEKAMIVFARRWRDEAEKDGQTDE